MFCLKLKFMTSVQYYKYVIYLRTILMNINQCSDKIRKYRHAFCMIEQSLAKRKKTPSPLVKLSVTVKPPWLHELLGFC